MTATKWPKLFPAPQATVFSCVWNLWRLETGTQSKDLNSLWNCWRGRLSPSLPKQRGGRVKSEQEEQAVSPGGIWLRSWAQAAAHAHDISLQKRTSIYSTPTNDPMPFTCVAHLMLIPSYPGPQGSEKLWPRSTGAQSSHTQGVKSSNTELMQINLSSLLAFLKHSERSM